MTIKLYDTETDKEIFYFAQTARAARMTSMTNRATDIARQTTH